MWISSAICALFIGAAVHPPRQVGGASCSEKLQARLQATVEMSEVDWRFQTNQYLCVTKCVMQNSQPAKITTPPPQFIERVFAPTRRIIDCNNAVRQISKVCTQAVNTLTLQQLGQLPLLYFSSSNMMSRFGAEKFCSRHGLTFGLAQDEMFALLALLPDYNTANSRFWAQALNSTGNKIPICSSVTKEEAELPHGCDRKLNFVCSLPEMCHQDACQQKCASKKDDLFCRASNPELEPPKCFPKCPTIDCSESAGESIGFEPGEGQLINACGRVHFVSKKSTFASANMYCCEKRMKLTGLESQFEIKCLASELKKRKEGDAKFWTSASSAGCPKDFAFCSSSELLDYDGLGISRNALDASKQCLSATFTGNNSQLSLKEDDCTGNKARVICELPSHSMCKRSGCWKFKCPKEKKYIDSLRIANLLNTGIIVIKGCGREFNVKPLNQGPDTYYRGSKLSCGTGEFSLLSLNTPSKLKCVQELFLLKKVPSAQYWLGGTSFGCHWDNRWCQVDNESPLSDNGDIVWKGGEPSNDTKKECVGMEFNSEKTPHITLFKWECDKKLLTIMESKIVKS